MTVIVNVEFEFDGITIQMQSEEGSHRSWPVRSAPICVLELMETTVADRQLALAEMAATLADVIAWRAGGCQSATTTTAEPVATAIQAALDKK